MKIPRSRIDVTVTPSISSADVGCWYRRRLVAHHRTSVLDEFSCTLFDLIQLAMSLVHAAINDENALTSFGRHKPPTCVSSAVTCHVF